MRKIPIMLAALVVAGGFAAGVPASADPAGPGSCRAPVLGMQARRIGLPLSPPLRASASACT
ncbi:MAG: hypothetical protein M3Y19_00110 [Actinomycetota bacterium]|nr:hypothetical protein [Actinomycetota bacterium]